MSCSGSIMLILCFYIWSAENCSKVNHRLPPSFLLSVNYLECYSIKNHCKTDWFTGHLKILLCHLKKESSLDFEKNDSFWGTLFFCTIASRKNCIQRLITWEMLLIKTVKNWFIWTFLVKDRWQHSNKGKFKVKITRFQPEKNSGSHFRLLNVDKGAGTSSHKNLSNDT